jgi:mono/diheme cytochrome c family protein
MYPTSQKRRLSLPSTEDRHRWLALSLGVLCCSMLAACGVDFESRHAREEVLAMAQPAGSVHWGWQVFQSRCAFCHGADAAGTPKAPNLLLRMKSLGPQRFETLVLMRYDLSLPVVDQHATSAGSTLRPSPSMPAWQGVPSVQTQIKDLYRYLSERTQGKLGPCEPETP